MEKQCAYCDGPGPFTKEHVMASWLEKMFKNTAAGLLQRAGKVIEDDPEIRDTCEYCNHVLLSMLDNYVRGLYDKYLVHFVRRGDSMIFECDLHQLTRWLLKVAYNSARVHNSSNAIAVFRRLRPYILTGQPIPSRLDLYLQLITATEMSSSEVKRLAPAALEKLTKSPNGIPENPPPICQISVGLEGVSRFENEVICRLVGIHSFHFWILVPRGKAVHTRDWSNARMRFRQEIKGATLLNGDRTEVHASTTRGRELTSASLQANRGAYWTWLLDKDIAKKKAGKRK